MKILKQNILIIFFLIFSYIKSTVKDFLVKTCQPISSPNFNIFDQAKPIQWSLKTALKNGRILGEGGYATVYSVNFPFKEITSPTFDFIKNSLTDSKQFVAVKKTRVTINTDREIKIHVKLTQQGLTSAFLGCFYEPKFDFVLIVQQKLHYAMSKKILRTVFLNCHCPKD